MKSSPFLLPLSGLLLCGVSPAALIQTGGGGVVDPGVSPGGFVGASTTVTPDSVAFTNAGLWDGSSSTVGGGAISGTVYYAWTGRSADRQGGAGELPIGLSEIPGTANPGGSFGGGQIFRTGGEVLGVGNSWGAWAYSTFGSLGSADLLQDTGDGGSYLALHPEATMTFLVQVDFVGGGDDLTNVTMYWGDPASPVQVATASFTGDASFDSFQFRAGHESTTDNNRWDYSDVAFATTAEEALAAVPEPSAVALAALGALGLLRRRR